MALAVHSAEAGQTRLLALFLIVTMIIGVAFLGIKFTEYYLHYQDHKVPGVWFDSSGPLVAQIQMFSCFYFIMTGLHAVHMHHWTVVAVCVGGLKSFDGRVHGGISHPVVICGLHWHFVDIVLGVSLRHLLIRGLHK